MIEITPEYLRSRRTLTEAQVRERDRARARFDLTPAERLDMVTGHVECQGSRH